MHYRQKDVRENCGGSVYVDVSHRPSVVERAEVGDASQSFTEMSWPCLQGERLDTGGQDAGSAGNCCISRHNEVSRRRQTGCGRRVSAGLDEIEVSGLDIYVS